MTARRPALALAFALLLATFAAPPAPAASFPAAHGTGGAVVSPERSSTDVGLEILRRGGSAADAAVAVAVAMAVVHPQAGNLGGGGFAVIRFGGSVETLDFRETAPAAAHRDMYLDDAGVKRPGSSEVGPLAAGVPGSIRGLWELHRKYGRLRWADVVAPAERLAARGFRVTRRLSASIEEKSDKLGRFEETAAVYMPGGRPLQPGDWLRQPALAHTLARYGAEGPEALTRGALAAAVEAASERHGGILTAADLDAYRPVWRRPVEFSAFGWSFASMDLPSSGGIILGQTFMVLERLGYASHPPRGADRQHLLAEVWRRAYSDRYLLGDPASTKARAAELLDGMHLDEMASAIDLGRAAVSDDLRPGARAAIPESPETVHIAAIDNDGHVVSLTTTLNGTFGCGLVVSGTGYLLNNEMDDFTTAPGEPNLYGLIQGEANNIAPGLRMLSSMSPTIAWRHGNGGEELLAFGGRGGSRIPTSSAQVALHVIVDDLELQSAVNHPRVHHQWLPDRIIPEPDALSPETRAALEARGHTVEPSDTTAKVNAVRRLASGVFEAAGDPRGPSAGGVVDPRP